MPNAYAFEKIFTSRAAAESQVGVGGGGGGGGEGRFAFLNMVTTFWNGKACRSV